MLEVDFFSNKQEPPVEKMGFFELITSPFWDSVTDGSVFKTMLFMFLSMIGLGWVLIGTDSMEHVGVYILANLGFVWSCYYLLYVGYAFVRWIFDSYRYTDVGITIFVIGLASTLMAFGGSTLFHKSMEQRFTEVAYDETLTVDKAVSIDHQVKIHMGDHVLSGSKLILEEFTQAKELRVTIKKLRNGKLNYLIACRQSGQVKRCASSMNPHVLKFSYFEE